MSDPVLVQSKASYRNSTPANYDITLDSNLTTGSRVVVVFQTAGDWTPNARITGITDDNGNTYAQDAIFETQYNGNYYVFSGYIASGGVNVLHVAAQTAYRAYYAVAMEYSNVDTSGAPLTGTPAHNASYTNSPTTPSIVTAERALIIAYCTTAGAYTLTPDAGPSELKFSAPAANDSVVYDTQDAGTYTRHWSCSGSTTLNRTIIAYKIASGGTTYTLDGEVGTCALTGEAAGLRAARTLAAAVGSFALSGQAAGLRVARELVAGVGSFALTGQTAGLRAGRELAATFGAFTLAGEAAALRAGRRLAADAGAFALTGEVAALRTGLVGAVGTFTLSGQDAALHAARHLGADFGAFTLAGQDATLTRGGGPKVIDADAGAFTFTGQAAARRAGRRLSADAGMFALTGQVARLVAKDLVGHNLEVFGAGAVFTTSTAKTLEPGDFHVVTVINWRNAGPSAPPAIAGHGLTYEQLATVTTDHSRTTLFGARALTHGSDTLTATNGVAQDKAVIIEAIFSGIRAARQATPADGTSRFPGAALGVLAPSSAVYAVAVTTGGITTIDAEAGYARIDKYDADGQLVSAHEWRHNAADNSPSFTLDAAQRWAAIGAELVMAPLTLLADAGSFALTGEAAILSYRRLVADAGMFALTGQAATLRASRKLPAARGSFTLTGQAAALYPGGHRLAAAAGLFTLSGEDARLLWAHIFAVEARAGLRGPAMAGELGATATAGTLRPTGATGILRSTATDGDLAPTRTGGIIGDTRTEAIHG